MIPCAVCGEPVTVSKKDHDRSRPWYCRKQCFVVARVLNTGSEPKGLTMLEAIERGELYLKRWGKQAPAFQARLRAQKARRKPTDASSAGVGA